KPKVSTRFYRGDASRGTPGVGLGLSLVASVAKVHGGVLELVDNNPGLRALMIIAAQSVSGSAASRTELPAFGQAGTPQELAQPATDSAAAAAHNLRMRSVS